MSSVQLWPAVAESLCYIFFKQRRILLINSAQPWQWALGCVIKTKRGTISQTARHAWKRTTAWADWQRERETGENERGGKERVPDWVWNTHISFSGILTLIIHFFLPSDRKAIFFFAVGLFLLRTSTFPETFYRTCGPRVLFIYIVVTLRCKRCAFPFLCSFFSLLRLLFFGVLCERVRVCACWHAWGLKDEWLFL